jgi:hypothetical protein
MRAYEVSQEKKNDFLLPVSMVPQNNFSPDFILDIFFAYDITSVLRKMFQDMYILKRTYFFQEKKNIFFEIVSSI